MNFLNKKYSLDRIVFFKSFIFLTVIFVFFGLSLSVESCCQLPTESHYTVIFNGRTLEDNTSTWSYTVTKTGCGPDLSHWVWDPCFDEEELQERFVSATPEPSGIGQDGSTLHYGIKWEVGDGFTSGTFTITINGQPDVDPTGATAVIKAGQAGTENHGNQPHFDLIIPGPSCVKPPPPEPYCGDGNIDCGEDCDEGQNNGIECTPEYGDSCTYCSLDCEIIEPEGGFCGDGIINGPEECEEDVDCCGERVCVDCFCEELSEPECGDGILDFGEQCDDGNNVDGDGCSAVCTIEGIVDEKVTIFAYKVVCETEEDLPNWATSGTQPGEPSMITATTAIDYVNNIQGRCWLEADWEFQWGPLGQKQNGEHIGPAPDGTGWNNFDSATGIATPAKVEIYDLQEGTLRIWVRENLKEGYLPFANPSGDLQDNVSAEMLCHTDILNFDNYDYIISPQLGETYYCVAFNALLETEPVCGNGVLETGEQCDDGNTTNGDGCSSACIIEGGPQPYCGDGILDQGEECDDGNNEDNDGCSANCVIEVPEPFCGDGNVDPGEECDGDIGLPKGYVCTEDCTLVCDADLDVIMVMDVSGSMGYEIPTRLCFI